VQRSAFGQLSKPVVISRREFVSFMVYVTEGEGAAYTYQPDIL
jgi:hypothetical protein